MKLVLALFIFLSCSFANAQEQTRLKALYDCVLKFGKTTKISIANVEFLVPSAGMPAILSGTSNSKCFIIRNGKKQNGLILSQKGSQFLLKAMRDVQKTYQQTCANKSCYNNFDCKGFSYALNGMLGRYSEDDKKYYGVLIETSDIIRYALRENKECQMKIDGMYRGQGLEFYNDSSCINSIAAKHDGYVNLIAQDTEYLPFSEELKSCLLAVKDA